MDAKNHAFGAKLEAVGHRLSKHLDFLIFMHTAMLMLLVAIYAFLLGKSVGTSRPGRRGTTTLSALGSLRIASFASCASCQRVAVAV